MIIEGWILFYIFAIFIISIVINIHRFIVPNHFLKRYLSGESKVNDSFTRVWVMIFIVLSTYILLHLVSLL